MYVRVCMYDLFLNAMEVLIFRESDERNKYTDFPSNCTYVNLISNFSKNKKFRQNT